jgi:hypothetical protein
MPAMVREKDNFNKKIDARDQAKRFSCFTTLRKISAGHKSAEPDFIRARRTRRQNQPRELPRGARCSDTRACYLQTIWRCEHRQQ